MGVLALMAALFATFYLVYLILKDLIFLLIQGSKSVCKMYKNTKAARDACIAKIQ